MFVNFVRKAEANTSNRMPASASVWQVRQHTTAWSMWHFCVARSLCCSRATGRLPTGGSRSRGRRLVAVSCL